MRSRKNSLKWDESVPIGTYVDMSTKLPMVDPEKIPVPTIVMRGQYDGIAGIQDLYDFFARLPNPDKQFAHMPGVAHASFQQTNYLIVYHILYSFFTQPAPIFGRRRVACDLTTNVKIKNRISGGNMKTNFEPLRRLVPALPSQLCVAAFRTGAKPATIRIGRSVFWSVSRPAPRPMSRRA